MDREKLSIMYNLTEKAKAMEKIGNDDKALELYLELINDHHPHVSHVFERASVILEKKRRYDEAIEICNRAIDLIKQEKISGNVATFQSRINRIDEKNSVNKPTVDEPVKKTFKLDRHKVIRGGGLLLVIGILFFIFMPRPSNYEDLYIDMSEMERESELEGSIFTEADAESLPAITAEMIDTANNILLKNVDVQDVSINVGEDTIGFAILTSFGTSKSRSEELGELYMVALSQSVASKNNEISGPSALSFGEIYDYYDVIISVGPSTDDIVAKGTKVKSSNKLVWRN